MARKPTVDELRAFKDQAAEAAARGKLEKAADLYRRAAEGDPRDVAARQKLAETLRRAGRTEEAIEAYRAVAERFAKDGLLVKAIAISKAILELDPTHVETQGALAELYAKRAQAEGARPPLRTVMVAAVRSAPPASPAPGAPRAEDEVVVSIPLRPPALELPPEVPVPQRAPPLHTAPPVPPRAAATMPLASAREGPVGRHTTMFARIMSAAERAVESGVEKGLLVRADPVELGALGDEPLSSPGGRGVDEIADEPPPRVEPVVEASLPRIEPAREQPAAPPQPAPRLPHVPIFSDLDREAFLELTAAMELHRVSKGQAVIREGEEGASFFVVASGQFAVAKRDDSGRAIPLARLGAGDFFGEMALLSGASRAATVTSEEEGEVLEFRADVLLDVAGRHPHLAQSLRRFYRQRLLANAMTASPIFRPFQRVERKLIVERFRTREVREGEAIVREGQPSDGLYVVLEGAVDVVKRKDGRDVVVGHLREGDLFGEMSCLRKAPASATVLVRRPGTLLRLTRSAFDELVVTHPQILELVSTLTEERAENLDAILSGRAEWTDDGLVLI